MARAAYFAPGVYVEELPSARQPIAGVGTNTAGFIGVVPDTIWYPVRSPSYDPVLARTLLAYRRSRAAASTDDTARAAAEAEAATLRAREAMLRERFNALQQPLTELRHRSEEASRAVTEAASRLTGASGQDADDARAALEAARRAASEAAEQLGTMEREHDDLQHDLEELDRQLAPPAAAAPAGPGGAAAAPAGPGGAPAAPAGPGGAPATPAAGAGAAAGGTQTPQFGETDEDYQPSSDGPEPELTRPSIFRPCYLESFTVPAAEFDTKLCTNFSEYTNLFGEFSAFQDVNPAEHDPLKKAYQPYHRGHHLLTHAVFGFFANGGTRCFVSRVRPDNISHWTRVLDQMEFIEDVSILAAPGLPKNRDTWEDLQTYCESDAHMNVFAILDLPLLVEDAQHTLDVQKLQPDNPDALLPRRSAHAAYYFPHIEVMDPAKRMQDSDPAWGVPAKIWGRTYVTPSGHMAGIYARTDEERGVHKAPANAIVRGALEVRYYVSKPKQELLNPQGVNCIRLMNGDVTVWGARNIGGDSLGEWKYISVRRFAGFLEESISRGTQWVVFEPNDDRLWSRIILNITAFLTNVWRSGALFGLTAQEAFYVKCDAELNPPEVRDLGQVITEIGVAIVRPAEFVIFRITQSTGQQQG